MDFSIKAFDTKNTLAAAKSGCIAVAVYENKKLSAAAKALDVNGDISAALKSGDISGKPGSTLLLRWIPHRNGVGLPRIATEDVEVGGVLIRAGEAVYASYLAANRDPAAFEDPDRLDFDREGIGHVSFGHGPHHCMGAMLTRMESEVMLSTLLDRYPRLRLAGSAEDVVWQSKGLIRGPKELLVTW